MFCFVRKVFAPLVVTGLLAQSASAATLFFDDFNRAPNAVVGNGWIETPTTSVSLVNAGAAHLGVMQLKSSQSYLSPSIQVSASHDSINATGFTDIAISFDYELHYTEILDTAYVEWRVGGTGSWTTLASTVGGILFNDTWFSVSNLSLGALAADNPNVGIEFRLRSSATLLSDTDYLKIDNVLVTGDALPPVQPDVVVPEPASLAVWGVLGCVGLFYTRRKLV